MMRAFWLAAVMLGVGSASAQSLVVPSEVGVAERQRIDTIERLSRSTIAIFERSGGNGGSGVIISEDGLALTNFHVTSPCGAEMVVGTSDGQSHTAVLLGLDPTGDIALIRLLGEGPWPAAAIGDSDAVRVGDAAIVAGNPFLLAEDFTPSISVGVVSGTHRYQPPADGLLEYADCLQVDAAINPGNSGGPLFDGQGRLIGINGRGSFEKRGRVNVGFGYAVSINQVMRFVSVLEAGRVADHASLGATATTRNGPRTILDAIETTSAAYRRGLRPGDEIVSFNGRDTPTANTLLNALGVLPAGWPVRIAYRRDGTLRSCEVRLSELHAPGVLREAVAGSTPQDAAEPDLPTGVYSAHEDYANGVAQQRVLDRLLASLIASQETVGPIEREYQDAAYGPVTLRLADESAEWISSKGEYRASMTRDLAAQAAPPAAPPLLGSLWVWRALVAGEAGRIDRVEALGDLPWQAGDPPGPALAAFHRGLRVEVYFDPDTGLPRGLEAMRDQNENRVRVDFGGAITPAPLPDSVTIVVGDRRYATLEAVTPQEGTP